MAKQDKSPDPAILGQIFRDAPLPLAIYNLAGELTHSNDAHHAFAEALGDAAGIGHFNALYDLRSKRCGHYDPFRHAVDGAVLDYAFSVTPAAETEALHFRRVLLPAYDQQQKPMGVVSVIVDVREWLHAERDKSRLLAELQQGLNSVITRPAP